MLKSHSSCTNSFGVIGILSRARNLHDVRTYVKLKHLFVWLYVPNSWVAQFRGNAVFYRSTTSGWSLEVGVYAELTAAVVGIASQQNMNLFTKIIVG